MPFRPLQMARRAIRDVFVVVSSLRLLVGGDAATDPVQVHAITTPVVNPNGQRCLTHVHVLYTQVSHAQTLPLTLSTPCGPVTSGELISITSGNPNAKEGVKYIAPFRGLRFGAPLGSQNRWMPPEPAEVRLEMPRRPVERA
jgi:hypothetical protein